MLKTALCRQVSVYLVFVKIQLFVLKISLCTLYHARVSYVNDLLKNFIVIITIKLILIC